MGGGFMLQGFGLGLHELGIDIPFAEDVRGFGRDINRGAVGALEGIGDFFSPDIPEITFPELEEEDKDIIDEAELERIAQQRRSIERRRRGRRSLRIDAPTVSGLSATPSSGLSLE